MIVLQVAIPSSTVPAVNVNKSFICRTVAHYRNTSSIARKQKNERQKKIKQYLKCFRK